MKYGISFLYFQKDLKCDWKAAIRRIADLGFDILEIDSSLFLGLSKEERAAVKGQADECGIELYHSFSLGADTDISSDDAAVRDHGVGYIREMLYLVHEMGGTAVGGINYTGHHCFEGALEPDRRRENSINALKSVMPAAEALGIDYNIEVTNGYENFIVNTAGQAKLFCEKVGSERMGILLDVNHMLTEEDSFGEAIVTAGNRLRHFHVAQNNRKAPRTPGFLPWDDIRQGFEEIGYQGAVTLEPLVLAGGELGKGARFWRDKCGDPGMESLCRDIGEALAFVRGVFGK